MYLDHFGLYTAPFSLVPHLRFLYLSASFEETMAHLLYGLDGGEDIILITGEIGSGKTLALHNLACNIKGQYEVVVVNTTQVNFNELLKLVLSDQGFTLAAGLDRADLLTLLKQHLESLNRAGKRLLLVIDEAQNLDVATLEGVRLLTNLGPVTDQLLQLILAGQPGLRKKINLPELAQVRQRIRVHYHLGSLSARETSEYIEHRLKVAGCEKSLFSRSALELIHRRSFGVPRLVNTLADQALLAAYVDGVKTVQDKHIPDDNLARTSPDDLLDAERAARYSETLPLIPKDELTGDTDKDVISKVTQETHNGDDTDYDSRSSNNQEPSSSRLRIGVGLFAVAAIIVLVLVLQLNGGNNPNQGSNSVGLGNAEPVATEPVVSASDTLDAPLSREASVSIDSLLSQSDSVLVAGVVNPDSASFDNHPEVPLPGSTEAEQSEMNLTADDSRYVLELVGPCIHVASFLDLNRAVRMKDQLAAISNKTAILKVVINGDFWYRVYSGPWESVEQAQLNDTAIHEHEISGWTQIVIMRKP